MLSTDTFNCDKYLIDENPPRPSLRKGGRNNSPKSSFRKGGLGWAGIQIIFSNLEHSKSFICPNVVKISYRRCYAGGLCPPNIAGFLFERWAKPTLLHQQPDTRRQRTDIPDSGRLALRAMPYALCPLPATRILYLRPCSERRMPIYPITL